MNTQKNMNEYLPLNLEGEVESSNFIPLKEGYYIAKYIGTALKTGVRGEFLKHKYEVLVGSLMTSDVIYLYDLTDLKITSENKLGRIYKAFVRDFEIGEKLNLKDLVGEGKNYAKIKITPVKNKSNFTENKIVEYLPISSHVVCVVEDF